MANWISPIDDMFDDMSRLLPSSLQARWYSSAPALNVDETDDAYRITVMIPGIDAKDIKIELLDNQLVISYEQKQEANTDTKSKSIRNEYTYSSWSRSITLPNHIDSESVEATSERGELFITLKKIQKKPQLIQVSTK